MQKDKETMGGLNQSNNDCNQNPVIKPFFKYYQIDNVSWFTRIKNVILMQICLLLVFWHYWMYYKVNTDCVKLISFKEIKIFQFFTIEFLRTVLFWRKKTYSNILRLFGGCWQVFSCIFNLLRISQQLI